MNTNTKVLTYFGKPDKKDKKGAINLSDIRMVNCLPPNGQSTPTDYNILLITKNRTWNFSTDTGTEQTIWIAVFQHCVNMNKQLVIRETPKIAVLGGEEMGSVDVSVSVGGNGGDGGDGGDDKGEDSEIVTEDNDYSDEEAKDEGLVITIDGNVMRNLSLDDSECWDWKLLSGNCDLVSRDISVNRAVSPAPDPIYKDSGEVEPPPPPPVKSGRRNSLFNNDASLRVEDEDVPPPPIPSVEIPPSPKETVL